MADRFDFFFRQKVTEGELDAAFDALEQADFAQILDLGLIGILQNAVVTEKSGTPDLTVDISGSSAVHDKLGQRIAWGPSQNVDVSVDENSISTQPPAGQELIVSLFAKFERSLTDPRIDGNSATVFFNRAESFDFVVRQGAATASPPATPPALDAEFILLADIRRANPQTQIFNADITPPGGTYTAITNRREAAFKLSAGALAVLTGTPEESDQAILTELNNHITGVSNAHDAVAVDYAGGAAWHDGTTNPAATVEAQLDKIIVDLTDAAGSDRIGAAVYAGNNFSVAAGSIQDQLREIADELVYAGDIAFTGSLDFQNGLNILSAAGSVLRFTGANATLQFDGGGTPQISANGGVDFYITLETSPDIRFVVRKDDATELFSVNGATDEVVISGSAARFQVNAPSRYADAQNLYGDSDGSDAANGVWLGYDGGDAEGASTEVGHRFAGVMAAWHNLRWDFQESTTLANYSGLNHGTGTSSFPGDTRGILQLQSPAVTGQSCQPETVLVTYDRNDGDIIFEYLVEPQQITNVNIELGFMNIGGVDVEDNVTACMAVFSTEQGDSFWTLVGASGGATTRSAGSVAPVAGVRQRLTVRCNSDGSAEMWVNGVSQATLAAGVVGSSAMWWQMRVESRSAATREVQIDRYEQWVSPTV